MTYNVLNGNTEMPESIFKLSKNHRMRGHKYKLEITRTRIDLRKHFFTHIIKNRGNEVKHS